MRQIIAENATFFEKMTACFGDFSQFEQNIQQIAQFAEIDLHQYEIDHLAVRMNRPETAKEWQHLLEQNATLLKESQVNGRPIALYSLTQAVKFCGQNVSVIELPFPKGKTYPQEGWEHIELVIPMRENENVTQWTERLLAQFKLNDKPELALKISQPEVQGERLPNPTIAIKIKNATFQATFQNTACLKLHPYHIRDVIRSESDF